MSATWRKLLIGAVVIFVIGGLAWMATRPEIIPVDLAVIERGSLEVTINADGETRVREIFEVSAPVSGRLLRSPVKIGERVVAQETIVARIEPGSPAFLDTRSRSQAEATVAQAEAALSVASAQVTMAELDLGHAQLQLNRLHDLHERGTIPQAQLEDAELALDIAAAMLDSAHAAYDMRVSELAVQEALLIGPEGEGSEHETSACCIELKAPVSGQILGVVNESTRIIASGTPILTIGQMQDLEIAVELLSSDAVGLTPGAQAYVERWGGGEVLMAQLREIEPAAFTKVSALGIEEQRVRALLDFSLPAGERPALGHGFRVFLRIVEWRGEDVARLPISALFRQNGDWAVFVVDNGTALLRTVEIGQRNTEFAEILGGLELGEHVITHPSDRISNQVLVMDRETL
ncbi:MAG: RND transporter [Rhodobacteraceae bacterium]|nr:RND transporter [Paracoccaceae bacterium]